MQNDLIQLMGGRQGHFRYESGYHSDLWMDLDGLFRRQRVIQPLIDGLLDKLAAYNLDCVCGPMVGGAFLAQSLAATLDVDFLYAERFAAADPSVLYGVSYHLPVPLRPFVQGKRIAIVDDVVSAGSAVRGVFADLQINGAITVVVGTLLLLGTAAPAFFAPLHIPVEATTRHMQTLWKPEECPICAAGIPFEDHTPDST